ncbi:MAG: glycerol-3-phosphate 1-O-acyltransferase PlsY [Clostridiales bacterium]|nr:glycerol-3-phosphate 1-O-acyltransferase PlsY [Clostridiales bacterium]
MITFCLTLTALLSYIIGGVNGSIIASKYIFHKDIREMGSGNAGLTNFYRIFGTKGVLLVLAIDILKSAIAVIVGHALMRFFGFPMTGEVFAGFFLILGHVFPVWYGFRGGKGVLCCGILVLFIDWRIGLICWIAFILVTVLTKYVSLGSMVGSIVFPIGIAAYGGWWLQVLLSILCCLLIIVMHRKNIIRLILHKEPKFSFRKNSAES